LWLMSGNVSKLAKESPRELTSDPDRAQGFMGAAWTPKGDIIYGYYTSGQLGLSRFSPADGSSHDLNMNSSFAAGPSACGTSDYFVFISSDGLVRADADGGTVEKLTSRSGDVFPACSPDGKTVFYNHVENGQSRLWRVGTDGQNAAQVGNKSYNTPAISPDGTRVAVLDFFDSPKLHFIILDAATGAVQSTYDIHQPMSISEGQTHMLWTPDGRAIAYIVEDSVSSVSNLWEQPIAAPGKKLEPPKQITNFTSMHIWSFAWSQDGKQLILARGRSSAGAVLLSHFH
ncbi:MAG: TolB family protein, partial [Candidatus Acidiferrales bacterium]